MSITSVGKGIDVEDFVAVGGYEQADEVGADEAGSAGDEDFHR